jgi:hypothetical protein
VNGETCAHTAPARGPVPNFPHLGADARPFLMADEGYPVSGDAIARHLDDPSPEHPTTRRLPMGDRLWPAVAASAARAAGEWVA